MRLVSIISMATEQTAAEVDIKTGKKKLCLLHFKDLFRFPKLRPLQQRQTVLRYSAAGSTAYSLESAS